MRLHFRAGLLHLLSIMLLSILSPMQISSARTWNINTAGTGDAPTDRAEASGSEA
jgi:hypothetical protein